MFRIEMLPAGHGDGLLITYGDEGQPHHVLIDGGPYYTYRNKKIVERQTLRRRIAQLVAAGHGLELVVVTHVDADHIESPVRLLGEKPDELAIRDVWFNGWRHLQVEPDDLMGPVHGEMFSALLLEKELPWNAAFDGRSVALSGDDLPVKELPGGLRLTLLAPTMEELDRMRRTWARALKKAGLDPDDKDAALERLKESRLAPELDDLMSQEQFDVATLADKPFDEDGSAANGSSIAFLAEYDGVACLFAGDAHPSTVAASVRRLLRRTRRDKLRLDALKLSHHGGKGNTSPELLELLACHRFLVSTNGSYFGHPHEETIARVLTHSEAKPTLYFNYASPSNKMWDDGRLREAHGYLTVYPTDNERGLVVNIP